MPDKITIAISKGRIYDEAIPLLARLNIVPKDDPETSRKLILETNQTNVQLLIIRATDVPTYVLWGQAKPERIAAAAAASVAAGVWNCPTLVVVQNALPDEDIPALTEIGIHGIFGPGTPTDEGIAFIREEVGKKRARA